VLRGRDHQALALTVLNAVPRHRHSSQNKGPSQRQLRVGELLRHSLSDILRQTDIRDPELSGVSVTVTEVKPSPDMRHATVFVEPLGGQNAGTIIAALNRHRGFLRGQLGHTIELKFTPELRFVEDTSFAEADRIAKILHSERVARDLQSDDENPEGDDGAQT
jgi:ribosome-binding factor A